MSNLYFDDFIFGESPEENLFDASFFEYIIETEEAKERLAKIYGDCLIENGELSAEELSNLVVGTGILGKEMFDASKVEKHKDDISAIISTLFLDDPTLSVPSMECGSVIFDYEEGPKAVVDSEWEWLIQLGSITGQISVLTPVEEFKEDGQIYIVKNDVSTKSSVSQKSI